MLPSRSCLLFFLLGAAATAQSTHWSVGYDLGLPVGSWGGPNPYVAGHAICKGFDVQFGQKLDAKWGYTLGLGSASFRRGKHDFSPPDLVYDPDTGYFVPAPGYVPKPDDEVNVGFWYMSFGAFYAVSKNSFDLYANIRYGLYQVDRNRIEEVSGDHGTPHYFIFHSTELIQQHGVVGIEVGVQKRIKWGLWATASYSFAPLDEDRVKASSMQCASLGLKYIWGHK